MGSGLREIVQDVVFPQPRSSYRGVDLRRCRSDGQLVSMDQLHKHLGHFVVQPVTLSLKERVLIWLKLIK